MPECERCGNFTDNPAADEYHYCDDCLARFDDIRESGVIISGGKNHEGYQVTVTADGAAGRSGHEQTQVEALARGRLLAIELSVDALFEYDRTGSRWPLDEYLNAHPEIHRDVMERSNRVPEQRSGSFLARLKSLLG